MDKIDKALRKLKDDERDKLLAALEAIVAGKLEGLNIKKLKGHNDLYRLRVGKNRLVYRTRTDSMPIVVFVGKRDGQTYRDF